MRSSYNMLTTMPGENSQSLKLDMEKNAMNHVERRRQNLFKNSVCLPRIPSLCTPPPPFP